MLRGSLEVFALSDVCRLMTISAKTGKLEVTRAAGRGKIFFREGDVYYAESSLSREPLGQKLIRSGMLSESQLRRALDENATSGAKIGRVLVANNWVTEDQLGHALKEQIEDAAFDLLRWESGEFDFENGVVADIEVEIAVSVENLVLEAARRLDELDMIKRKLPSEDCVLRMAAVPPAGAAQINITADEWRLLVLVDGVRTIADISASAGKDTFAAMQGLYGLLTAGLIELTPGTHEQEEVARETVPSISPTPPPLSVVPDVPVGEVEPAAAAEAPLMEVDVLDEAEADLRTADEIFPDPYSYAAPPEASENGSIDSAPMDLPAPPPAPFPSVPAAGPAAPSAEPPEPDPSSMFQVDRSTAVKELAGLFNDEMLGGPIRRSSTASVPEDDGRKRVEDDENLDKGLISKLIDGVKGL